jgi:hypothetical protein
MKAVRGELCDAFVLADDSRPGVRCGSKVERMSSSEIEVRSRPTVAKPKSDNNQAQQVIKAPAGPRAQGKAATLGGSAGKRGVESRSRFWARRAGCSGAFLFCFCRYRQYRIGVM